jgi:RimJ/RimL family protein N-acetyltransferase
VVIATERLDLHPFTVELASSIVAGDAAGRHWIEGFPREDDQDAAGMFLKLPGDTYCSYTIVDRGSGQTVGTIGFFGPPDERGAVMVGYGLAEAARGRRPGQLRLTPGPGEGGLHARHAGTMGP